MEDLFGMLIGAFLAGCIGIFTVYFTKFLEEKRTKKHTSKALLLEVQANQNRLQPLANVIKVVKKVDELKKGEEDEEKEDIIRNIQLPFEISFDRTVYSALSDKIGLLNPKIGEKVVQYYSKIKFTEDGDDNLRILHKVSHAKGYIRTIYERVEMKEYFTNAKEAYDIGRELIKSL